MKKLLILLLLVIQLNANNLKTYHNSKYNYSIDYPAEVLSQKEYPTNGDGVWLSDNKKRVKLTLTARYMVTVNTIEEAYKQSMAFSKEETDRELTYTKQKENWFVLSGYSHDKKSVFYEKRFAYEGKLVGYIFEYPTKEKNKYEKWIKVFNDSFDYGEGHLSVKEITEIKKLNESYQIYQKINKYDVFFMLAKTSGYIREWSKTIDLKYFHLWETGSDNEIIKAQIYIDREGRKIPKNETSGFGSIGFYEYNIKTKEFINTIPDVRNPIKEKYDRVWTKVMDFYVTDKPREYLYLNEKTYLYKKPNIKSKSKKFLIKNDCALIVDKTDDGWYQVFYYHPHWHTNTIMWIKFDVNKHGLIKD